jgi:hypothetical protein
MIILTLHNIHLIQTCIASQTILFDNPAHLIQEHLSSEMADDYPYNTLQVKQPEDDTQRMRALEETKRIQSAKRDSIINGMNKSEAKHPKKINLVPYIKITPSLVKFLTEYLTEFVELIDLTPTFANAIGEFAIQLFMLHARLYPELPREEAVVEYALLRNQTDFESLVLEFASDRYTRKAAHGCNGKSPKALAEKQKVLLEKGIKYFQSVNKNLRWQCVGSLIVEHGRGEIANEIIFSASVERNTYTKGLMTSAGKMKTVVGSTLCVFCVLCFPRFELESIWQRRFALEDVECRVQ